ncbi:MAG: hypothetical protein LBU81_01035 [Methanosarcinales archaeon]|jgi:hypothetical protein|nr:hypothetical protein [Methanosarcinales archaeon]
MKREMMIRIFCLALFLLGAAYHLIKRPEGPFFYIVISPLLLLTALSSVKKNRQPDYSKYLSLAGVLPALISYVIYFTYALEFWKNGPIEIICVFIFIIYYIFLIWYKKQGA